MAFFLRYIIDIANEYSCFATVPKLYIRGGNGWTETLPKLR